MLDIGIYTYFWTVYWCFLILGTLGTILGVLTSLSGLRHYSLIWTFLFVGFLGLISSGAPLRESFSQLIDCDDSGVGNYCKNNTVTCIGLLLWVVGMIISLCATVKGSGGHYRLRRY